MQPAEFAHSFVPRPQIQMIGIRKDDFGAQLFERLVTQTLDARLRTHRHEERRLHGAVRRVQNAASCTSWTRLCYFKRKTHPVSVSGENPGNCREEQINANEESERNSQGFAERKLLWIGRGEPVRDENHRPNSEDVNRSHGDRLP
jgi:hypothetical protein